MSAIGQMMLIDGQSYFGGTLIYNQTMTVSSYYVAPPAGNAGDYYGYYIDSFGSLSSTAVTGGYTIDNAYDYAAYSAYLNNYGYISIYGFSSDPGASFVKYAVMGNHSAQFSIPAGYTYLAGGGPGGSNLAIFAFPRFGLVNYSSQTISFKIYQ